MATCAGSPTTPTARQLWRERVLALACALHGRLGAESPAALLSVYSNHCEPAVRLADGDVVEAWLRRGGRDPNNRGGWLTGIAVNGRLCYTSAVPLPESCTAVYPVIDIYGKTSEITLLQD
eukprot:m51a1_g8894 hypothetical protein (121) ;mRNA; r:692154-693869